MQPASELQATAGLYSHELDITGVKVDGEDADFELLSHEQQDSITGKLSALLCHTLSDN